VPTRWALLLWLLWVTCSALPTALASPAESEAASGGTIEGKPVEYWVLQLGSSERLRSRAAAILTTAGPSVIAALESVVGRTDEQLAPRDARLIRYGAAKVLLSLGEPGQQALVRLLEHAEPEIRHLAALSLSKAGPGATAAVPVLLEIARSDPNRETQRAATVSLGRIGDPEGLVGLLRMIRMDDDRLRAAMGGGLSAFEPETVEGALPGIKASLTDEDPKIRASVAGGLLYLGENAAPALPLLETALADTNPVVRMRALKTWGILLGEKARPAGLAALKDPDPGVRAQGVALLPADGESVGALEKALEDEDPEVRSKALCKVSRADKEGAVPLLLTALKDKIPEVRVRAARGLGAFNVIHYAPHGDLQHAVTALAGALRDGSPEVRKAAAISLRRLGVKASEAAPALAAALKDPDAEVRKTAAEALAETRDVHDIAALIAALNDQEDPVRIAAAKTLAKHASGSGWSSREDLDEERPALRPAVPVLREMLQDEYVDVCRAAIQALGAMGREARPAVSDLMEIAEKDKPYLASEAALALGKIGDPRALPTILAAWDRGWEWDMSNASHIGAMGMGHNSPYRRALIYMQEEAIPFLIKHLGQGSQEERDHALYALGEVGYRSETAMEAIMGMLASDDPTTQLIAMSALGKLRVGAEAAVPRILSLLKGADHEYMWSAADALADFGRPALPHLLKGLEEEEPMVRLGVIHAFREMDPTPDEAVPALVERLEKDQDPGVRSAAAQALGLTRTDRKEVMIALAQGMFDGDATVRQVSAQALTWQGPAPVEALPTLIRALKMDGRVPQNAATALGRMGPEAAPAVPALMEVIGNWTDGYFVEAVRALGQIGPAAKPAVPAIIEVLRGSQRGPSPKMSKAGAAAAEGLGSIGDTDAIPALAAVVRQGKVDSTRRKAAESLLKLGPPALSALIEAVQKGDDRGREIAIRTLGEFGPEAAVAIPAVTAAKEDPIREVRRAAREALSRLLSE